MWLIDVKTRELVQFMDPRKVAGQYAILSHTWEEDELTFFDGQNMGAESGSKSSSHHKKGYQKVDLTCHQAKGDGLQYAWIDTCCINKESSAELSEAINSMFRWYQNAKVCYVYLSDTTNEIMRKPGFWNTSGRIGVDAAEDFSRCRWFTRGWTLQELLAPKDVRFFAKDWTYIGTKQVMRNTLSKITGLRFDVLVDPDMIWRCSISERMSWAADRSTTREEDSAYCLLGILNVNIPLLYGEGPRAFTRLQEEILRTSLDHSLLCWRARNPAHRNELLAPDVTVFKGVTRLANPVNLNEFNGHQLLNNGLSITLPVRPSGDNTQEMYAALNLSAAPAHAKACYAVLKLRRISPDHDRRVPERPTTYEIVREAGDGLQPQEFWHTSYYTSHAEVSLESLVILPYRVSTTVCFDYPSGVEIIEPHPKQCFIRDTAEFHFLRGHQSIRSGAQPLQCCVKFCDKASGESRYLWVSELKTPNASNWLSLHFRVDKLSHPPSLFSEMAIWSLNEGATVYCARSWDHTEREDIPPGVYVIRIWNVSEGVLGGEDWYRSDLFSSELAGPTASLLARWNMPITDDSSADVTHADFFEHSHMKSMFARRAVTVSGSDDEYGVE